MAQLLAVRVCMLCVLQQHCALSWLSTMMACVRFRLLMQALAIRWQIVRQLWKIMGPPSPLEQGPQADQVAAAQLAMQAGHLRLPAPPGLPAELGVATFELYPRGRVAGPGSAFVDAHLPVRGWHQFAKPETASGDEIVLREGDLLVLARWLELSAPTAGAWWQHMVCQLEKGGVQALDEHIVVQFRSARQALQQEQQLQAENGATAMG